MDMTGKSQDEVVSILRSTKRGSSVNLCVSRPDGADNTSSLPRQMVSRLSPPPSSRSYRIELLRSYGLTCHWSGHEPLFWPCITGVHPCNQTLITSAVNRYPSRYSLNASSVYRMKEKAITYDSIIVISDSCQCAGGVHTNNQSRFGCIRACVLSQWFVNERESL